MTSEMSQTKEKVTQETKSVKPKSLAMKLIEIRASLGPVKKEKRNPHFGYNYVGEGQIMALLEPKFTEHGILYTTSVETQEIHYPTDPKAGVFVAVTTLHTFEDAETGEKLVLKGAGLGWDSGDKGSYKAQTGSVKYNLLKNMMISDEQDPEANDQRGTGRPAGAQGHSRVRPYEEETGEGSMKVATDLIEFKAFLTEHKIPDGFVLRLLQEKGSIDGRTKTVAGLKPGVLRRCLADKAKAILLKTWTTHQKDEGAGEASEPEPKKEVRTREGDQTRDGAREPIQTDLEPKDVLEQDGYTDWRQVPIHFGEQRATPLGKLTKKSLSFWMKWEPRQFQGEWNEKDILLDAALTLASRELAG